MAKLQAYIPVVISIFVIYYTDHVFCQKPKKKFLYIQWIHIFMLEELETHS